MCYTYYMNNQIYRNTFSYEVKPTGTRVPKKLVTPTREKKIKKKGVVDSVKKSPLTI